MKTLREYMDKLDEISRRDFLKGAAAIAGAVSGAANAEKLGIEPLLISTDGSVTVAFVSRPGKAINGWLALKKRNGQWKPKNDNATGRIQIDGNKIITVGFDFVNTDPQRGRDELGPPDYSLANIVGTDYMHLIRSANKKILMDLSQIGGNIVEFDPRSMKENVQEAGPDAVQKVEDLFRNK